MLNEVTKDELFCRYYAQWIRVYKEGAIRKVTMDKYLMTQAWLEKLVPTLKLCELTRWDSITNSRPLSWMRSMTA